MDYPYLLLLISGGHSQYLIVNGLGNYNRIGTTIDDALGEAFDKTAKLLGIEFPGGPKIEIFGKKGDPKRFKLPKPIINKGGCNLSFAGLKTAILKITNEIETDQDRFDLAASFQKTIEEILYLKTKIAFYEFQKVFGEIKKKFVVAGGVAANQCLRNGLRSVLGDNRIMFPDLSYCTDNGAMISYLGEKKIELKKYESLSFSSQPNLKLS